MKEIFMQMREEERNENIEKHIESINTPNSNQETDILCPNCMVDGLLPSDNDNELVCIECGYDFIRIDYNTVRFK